MQLTEVQRQAANAEGTSFLLGSAGSGKSTALRHRLLRLLQDGEPAYTILVLVAESEDADQIRDFIHGSELGPYADLTITTYVRLAHDMIELFWPLVARAGGFERPYQPPTFIGYDLAQVLMWRSVELWLAQGSFADLRLRPQQIVSQLLDTLNRAALNRLTLEEANERQIRTWAGDSDSFRHLREANALIQDFRAHCLRNSVLDLSLIVRLFDTQLVNNPEFHRYFRERFRHLIVDNVEEQTPAGQYFVSTLMDETVSTAIAYDEGGGYKRFLAADPAGAARFHDRCDHVFHFEQTFTASPALIDLANLIENYLLPTEAKKPAGKAADAILETVSARYRREMVDRLMPVLSDLMQTEGIQPHEIAIIAPYLDETLRYVLTQALVDAGIPFTLLRRRSSPRDEPRVRAWLTWLALAHPNWGMRPHAYDVAEALALSLNGMDPARAALTTRHLYDAETGILAPTDQLPSAIGQRVGEQRSVMIDTLRRWLESQGDAPLDVFLHKVFDDLLAQPPFTAEPDLAGAAVSEWLVRTAGRLRKAAPALGIGDEAELGRTFIDGINMGLVTADPPEFGEPPDPDGVLVATMYAFLLSGRTVRAQVWLEASGTGWWDVPRQPLSNAFVLARSWPPDRRWTMEEEFRVRNRLLSRLVRGLVMRAREGIIVARSELDRRGQRQEGPLWRALRTALPRSTGGD